MKKHLLGVVLLVFILAGCAPSAAAVEKAMSQTQTAMPTVTPTSVPLPELKTLIPSIDNDPILGDPYNDPAIEMDFNIDGFPVSDEHYCAGITSSGALKPLKICIYRYGSVEKAPSVFFDNVSTATDFDFSQYTFVFPEKIKFYYDGRDLNALFFDHDLLVIIWMEEIKGIDLENQAQIPAYLSSLVYQRIRDEYPQ